MSEEKLKPCPFCGGEAKTVTDEYRESYVNEIIGNIMFPAASKAWTFCTVCGAMGAVIRDKNYDGYKDKKREERLKEKAITAWNKRVADTGKTLTCFKCHGKGEYDVPIDPDYSWDECEQVKCEVCGGTGKITLKAYEWFQSQQRGDKE